jgi:hypothetical protein
MKKLLIVGILGLTCSSQLFAGSFGMTLNYSKIDKNFYKNKEQSGAGLGIQFVGDYEYINPYFSLEFSGNGESVYKSSAYLGLQKNIYAGLSIGAGAGYTHLQAHSSTQNILSTELKAEYMVDNKYGIGVNYATMYSVSPYYDYTLHNDEQKNISYSGVYFKYNFVN